MLERSIITVLIAVVLVSALGEVGHRLTWTFCHVDTAFHKMTTCAR